MLKCRERLLSSKMAEASGRGNVVKEKIRQLEEITRLRQQCESYNEQAVNSDERISQLEEEIIRLQQQLQDLQNLQDDIVTHKDERISQLEEEIAKLQIQLDSYANQGECISANTLALFQYWLHCGHIRSWIRLVTSVYIKHVYVIKNICLVPCWPKLTWCLLFKKYQQHGSCGQGDLSRLFSLIGEHEDIVRLTTMQVTPTVAMQRSFIMLHSLPTVLSRYKATDNSCITV